MYLIAIIFYDSSRFPELGTPHSLFGDPRPARVCFSDLKGSARVGEYAVSQWDQVFPLCQVTHACAA